MAASRFAAWSDDREGLPLRNEQGDEVGLVDLFGEKDTRVAYFWMYGPQRERPCPMCANWLGSVNGNAADLKQHDALKVFSRPTVERQRAFAEERGWKGSVAKMAGLPIWGG